MRSQEEGAVSLRRFRIGLALTACASGLLVMIVQPITPARFGSDQVKRLAELESRQASLYQALAGKDQLFQNERRNYVDRIKKRDELLHQREQTIMLLRSRLSAEGQRAEGPVSPDLLMPRAAEPVGFAARTSARELQGSTPAR